MDHKSMQVYKSPPPLQSVITVPDSTQVYLDVLKLPWTALGVAWLDLLSLNIA
jgi:hypothetical protein